MSTDILRYIDSIARDKEIDPDHLIEGIEQAVAAAVAKKYGIDDLVMGLDRDTGKWECNYEIDLEAEGRILAQAVKQAIIGKVREAERDVLYEEYEQQIGQIAHGVIQRFEGDTTIINLGRNMEGIIPRAEKVRGEIYNIGDRVRAMVLEVKKVGTRLKVIMTRAHRDLVRCLFELEVPEIDDGIITIRRIEREPGYRTKLAVNSTDSNVDCVGACVGVRGTRIKSIIDELNGERIDIIRWNEDPETLITNALKPADIAHIELDDAGSKALVLVDEDQLSLAIGRKGQNVRLASKLTGWDIDIMTRAELEQSIAAEEPAQPEAEAAPDAEANAEAGQEQDAGSAESTGEGKPQDSSAPATTPQETPADAETPDEASSETTVVPEGITTPEAVSDSTDAAQPEEPTTDAPAGAGDSPSDGTTV